MAKPKEKEEAEAPPRNSQAVQQGYVTELAKAMNELDTASGPYKEAIKDILASAKDSGLKKGALKKAANFYRADQKKRRQMQEEERDCDEYLAACQLSLFE